MRGSRSLARAMVWASRGAACCAPTRKARLKIGQIGVEMGDSLDAAEIIFQRDVLVGSMGVFVGQAEADQNARHFEGVVHLSDEGDGTALANEDGLLSETLFQSCLCLLENRIVVGSHPRFPGAQNFKFAMDRFRKKLSNVLLHELGDLVRILVGYEARGEFGERL